MLDVTLKDIEAGAESLRKLADQAGMKPGLFIKFANAWRDVKEQLEIIGAAQTASMNQHTQFSKVALPDGSVGTIETFIDADHKRAHVLAMQQLRETKVTLPRSKPIAWNLIEEARAAKELTLTAYDVASLAWLIELPEG